MELDMTKGSPSRLILRFMIPVILGNIFQQLYNMVDTIIVGRYVGVQALAAVGATGTIMFLILGFMQGMTTGFTVLTAQRFGAGDLEGMRKSVGNAFTLSAIVTVVMTVGSVALMDWILTIMQTPEDIYQMSREYILIICWGMVFTVLYNMVSSILRAIGNSKVPLYFLILSAGINVVLDLVLIIVFHMGVAGAAVATLAAQGISGVLCVIYMFRKVPSLRLSAEHFKLDFYGARNQIGIGLPMALQFSITAIGTMLVQAALNILGSTIVASYTVACKVEQLVTQVFGAVGVTMATYSAQNRGINDLGRIRRGVRAATVMTAVYAVVIFGVVWLLLPYATKLFFSGDISEVIGYVRTYIMICGFFFVPLGLIFIYRNVLQGCGFVLMPTLGGAVELVSRAVAAYAAAGMKSYVGVCFANAGAWCSAGIFLLIAYLVVMRKMVIRENRRKAAMEKIGWVDTPRVQAGQNAEGDLGA